MNIIYKSISHVRESIPQNKTITLVAGCFDLFHVGHLSLLKYSKDLNEILVVCVLSDDCVKSYKGLERPIIKDDQRALLISELKCVDRVYIGDKSPSDYNSLFTLQPTGLVYGLEVDGKPSRILEQRIARIQSQFPNIKIYFPERFNDSLISTTSIIQKIKELNK